MARITDLKRRRRAKQSEEAADQGLPQRERIGVTGPHDRVMPQRILRRAEVEQTTGLPRATILRQNRQRCVPTPDQAGCALGRLARDGNLRVAERPHR
jgi:hypothetical protein